MFSTKKKDSAIAELFMILRHRPGELAYTKDGWFSIEDVFLKLEKDGFEFDRESFVKGISETSRIEFNPPLLRAIHGHSIDVEIVFPEEVPPDKLYHGTPVENIDSINSKGLLAKRHHVFLTDSKAVATDVVHRYDKKAAVFEIDSMQMHIDGIPFYISNNNVWLTDTIPAKYIKLLEIL